MGRPGNPGPVTARGISLHLRADLAGSFVGATRRAMDLIELDTDLLGRDGVELSVGEQQGANSADTLFP